MTAQLSAMTTFLNRPHMICLVPETADAKSKDLFL